MSDAERTGPDAPDTDDAPEAETPEPETPESESSEAESSDTKAPDSGAAGGPSDLDWLQALEGRVREASTRLRELNADNQRLRARVDELEEALEEARDRAEAAAADGGGDGGEGDRGGGPEEGDGEAAAWRREREEIRDRVQHLTDHLEALLGDDA